MKKISLYCLFLAFLTLSTPTAHATKIDKQKPLHIKINTIKLKNKINIIKGNFKKLDKENLKRSEQIVSNKKQFKKSNHIKRCASSFDTLTQQKIADSLMHYMHKQNRDKAIIHDIQTASQATNTDFKTMIIKAMIESDLGRLTTAKNSSARGIYQYIDATWLTLLKRYGAKIGYPQYAENLTTDLKTLKTIVKDNSRYSEDYLLNLRHDTKIASLIKAYQTKEDENALRSVIQNRTLTATDHYIAHMMGIPLAKKFYGMIEAESNTIPANIKNSPFKQAAALNPYFFYGSKRDPLTTQEIYKKFETLIERKEKQLLQIRQQYEKNLNPACTTPDITVSSSHLNKNRQIKLK